MAATTPRKPATSAAKRPAARKAAAPRKAAAKRPAAKAATAKTSLTLHLASQLSHDLLSPTLPSPGIAIPGQRDETLAKSLMRYVALHHVFRRLLQHAPTPLISL